MTGSGLAILAAAMTLAQASALPGSDAQPTGPPPPDCSQARVLEHPKWVRIPRIQDMSDIYPRRAYEFEKTDTVVVSCAVTREGYLKDCRLAHDANPGWDFDKATLKVVPFFQSAPLSTYPQWQTLNACARITGPPRVEVPMDWTIDH